MTQTENLKRQVKQLLTISRKVPGLEREKEKLLTRNQKQRATIQRLRIERDELRAQKLKG